MLKIVVADGGLNRMDLLPQQDSCLADGRAEFHAVRLYPQEPLSIDSHYPHVESGSYLLHSVHFDWVHRNRKQSGSSKNHRIKHYLNFCVL